MKKQKLYEHSNNLGVLAGNQRPYFVKLLNTKEYPYIGAGIWGCCAGKNYHCWGWEKKLKLLVAVCEPTRTVYLRRLPKA